MLPSSGLNDILFTVYTVVINSIAIPIYNLIVNCPYL